MRDERIEPGVFGIWRQVILIPEGMDVQLEPAQFQAVLTHEWNHAKRRDNFTAVLQMIAEAIFWFYPVVWMVGR
jgi:beta-lactamase regulating signal transducer with metallopeptidase domain